MLTKELLRYHIAGRRIKPDLIDVKEPHLLIFAKRLITLYEANLASKRKDLALLTQIEVNGKKDIKLAKGILKELDDRCEYSLSDSVSFPELRRTLFARSAATFKKGVLPENMADFRKMMQKNFPEEDPDWLVYGDLPENETLLKVRKTFPKELLERYNMSLVRSLLLYCSSLTITTNSSDAAELRSVFKYLKFFRLLCRASFLPEKKKEETKRISFVIDGPASILDNSVKYGLFLANFFPAVCRLSNWTLTAEIQLGEGKNYLLKLDETSSLVCHFENFSAYIPEELRLFASYFKEKSTSWHLVNRSTWHKMKNGELLFPDFSFEEGSTGKKLDVEIFHLWHKNRILQRLEEIEKGLLVNYLLAVEKSCIRKDEELTKRLSDSPYVFLFSNFPGVENICKFLDKAAGNTIEEKKKKR